MTVIVIGSDTKQQTFIVLFIFFIFVFVVNQRTSPAILSNHIKYYTLLFYYLSLLLYYLLRHTKSFETNNVTVISTSPISRYYCFFSSFLLLLLCSCSLNRMTLFKYMWSDQRTKFCSSRNQHKRQRTVQFNLNWVFRIIFFFVHSFHHRDCAASKIRHFNNFRLVNESNGAFAFWTFFLLLSNHSL